jgi:hypothetical protein
MECFPQRLHENLSRNPHKLRSRGLEPATTKEGSVREVLQKPLRRMVMVCG